MAASITVADAPFEFVQELACDLTPQITAALARKGILRAVQLAEIAATLPHPADRFEALASAAPEDEVEELWRMTGALASQEAQLHCRAALLSRRPDRHVEVLASLPALTEKDRIWVLMRTLAHVPAHLQPWALDMAAELPQFHLGAKGLAFHVREQAFRHAWDLFARRLPKAVGPRAKLVAVAPAQERAALVAQLVPVLRSDSRLGYSVIPDLLAHAGEDSRPALLRQALLYQGDYAAANIASALGEALRQPEVEERYVTLLDLGLRDYQWDRAVAYAHVARQRGPREAHCLFRATSLLDLMLGLPNAANEPLQYPVAVNHQLNSLLAVTLVLTGEERERREAQTLGLLQRIGPALSIEDMVPIVWSRAAQLQPSVDRELLDLIGAIHEDGTAFAAWVTIGEMEPRLEALAFDRVAERLAQRWARRHLPPVSD